MEESENNFNEEEFGDFDTWFDIFQSEMRNTHSYGGPIDKYAFESEYEEGKSPEQAANDWFVEMNAD